MADLGVLFWSILVLLVGYFVGTFLEKRHYASIIRREKDMAGKALVFTENLLPPLEGTPQMRLIAGSVVVSVDAFKKFASGIHSFFGARLSAYESLVDRARREALLRMREKAHAAGATMIFGVRLETSPINDGDPRRSTGVEIMAYGTAIVPAGATPVPPNS